MTQPISWVEISRSAIKHNIRQFNKTLGTTTSLMAVVKSNAYGHGIVEVSRIAIANGVRWLGVASLDEALQLREHSIRSRLLVLSFYNPEKLADAVRKNITLTVYSYSAAKKINTVAARMRRTATVHLKIDTGTSRLGITPLEAPTVAKKISHLQWIRLEGIFSHFADAENPNQKNSIKQLRIFNSVVTDVESVGISIPQQHIACSAASLLQPDSHFSLARIGISLYGLWSIEKDGQRVKKLHQRFKLNPALSWYTKVIQVKTVPAGGTIGYGMTHRVKRKTRIAVLPTGYWDGYPRSLSNKGSVLIQGKRCPVRGRICMNMMMVDVSGCLQVTPGEVATLIGTQKKVTISADELAKNAKTINYEIVTSINPLIQRKLIK